jgi:large subunit ribosomal protein L4
MKASVFDTQKQVVGSIELDDSIFGARVNTALFYDVVKMQLANRRAGTHKAKRIGEVSGTGKKPYKQKGTGNARHGSDRAVGMVKGAVAHPPEPRDYSYKLPRKMVQGALRSALSLRNGESALFVIRGWSPSAPKTKEAMGVLGRFGGKSALVVGSKDNVALAKSLRNLPNAKFLPVEAVNVYDILDHDQLLVEDGVLNALTARLAKATPSRKDREMKEGAASAS